MNPVQRYPYIIESYAYILKIFAVIILLPTNFLFSLGIHSIAKLSKYIAT